MLAAKSTDFVIILNFEDVSINYWRLIFMKKTKAVLKGFLIVFISLAAFLLITFIATLVAGFMQIEKNIEYQNNHLEFLNNEYYNDSYIPCNEQDFADFNIDDTFSKETKINEIAVMGTHNSYQMLATFPKRVLMKTLQIITFGLVENKAVFEMDTFTLQLEQGVRNLEIDIETVDNGEEVSFIVTHKPTLDNVTSAYDFAKALDEIVLWSNNNPGHIPIYLLIEPKNDVAPINNMQNFSLEYALEFDMLLKEKLGDKLLTPKLAMGDHESLEAMRTADDWPTLNEAAGKIIVLMHTCDVTQEYIDFDQSIKTQAMFPMLLFDDIDKSYASFILENDPETAIENNKITIGEKNLMVRTRADDYPDFSDERYDFANKCGSQIITTDYPPRSVRKNDHTFLFDKYMMKLLK